MTALRASTGGPDDGNHRLRVLANVLSALLLVAFLANLGWAVVQRV